MECNTKKKQTVADVLSGPDFSKNFSGDWKLAELKESMEIFNNTKDGELRKKMLERFFYARIIQKIHIKGWGIYMTQKAIWQYNFQSPRLAIFDPITEKADIENGNVGIYHMVKQRGGTGRCFAEFKDWEIRKTFLIENIKKIEIKRNAQDFYYLLIVI